MTTLEWSRITDLLEAIAAEPEQKWALLTPEPAHIRREVDRLLAAHQALEKARSAEGSGRLLARRYQLQEMLGTGGSGEAWLCLDLQEGSRVVVKVARYWEWFRADLKRRFQAEVDVLRTLRHPCIIQVLDSGETQEGAPFLVMPYVDGLTLRQLIDIGPLDPDAAASILEQLGAAIGAAHRAHVSHRDIKPENVMVQTQEDGSSRVFLIDFGIALFGDLEQQSGTTTRFFGTTQYMAPEQLLGKPLPSSDLYALALVAYEMLCGQSLFTAETPVGLYEQQRRLKQSQMQAHLATGVRSLLLKALNPDPGKRPSDAAAFSTKLAEEIRKPGSRVPSRRTILGIGLGSAAVALPGATWLNHQYGPPSAAEKLVTYKAGQNLANVGWHVAGRIDANVVVFDQVDGHIIGTSLPAPPKASTYSRFPNACEGWR
jgi:serine/threonine-protein kinase